MQKGKRNNILAIITGSLTGVANGLFGGGGGMVAVPLMTHFMKTESKISHATALLVILPITAVSAAVYAVNGRADASVILPVSIGTVIGGIVGAFALKKLKTETVTKLFAAVMLFAGVKLLFF